MRRAPRRDNDRMSKTHTSGLRKAARDFAVDGERVGYRSARVKSDTRNYEEVRFWRAGTTAQTL